MNKWESEEWAQSVRKIAVLRNHVRKLLEERPASDSPEFPDWYRAWETDAIRIFERHRWWDLTGRNVTKQEQRP